MDRLSEALDEKFCDRCNTRIAKGRPNYDWYNFVSLSDNGQHGIICEPCHWYLGTHQGKDPKDEQNTGLT